MHRHCLIYHFLFESVNRASTMKLCSLCQDRHKIIVVANKKANNILSDIKLKLELS